MQGFSTMLAFGMILAVSAHCSRAQGLQIFLDCEVCDETFMRSTFQDVDYVRDRKIADLQVISSRQNSGAGGKVYTFQFIGLQSFNEELKYDLTLATDPNTTRQERREQVLELIILGLGPYLANYKAVTSEQAQGGQGENPGEEQSVMDRWNFWVFEISSDFDFNHERQRKEIVIDNQLDIQRVTDEWRIRAGLENEYESNRVRSSGNNFTSNLNTYGISGSAVKSLGNHFSSGIFARVWSNGVRNINQGTSLLGALEYNIFPYQLVYKKEFTISYRAGINLFHYQEETLFDQTEETLYHQSLSIFFNLIEPWGGIRAEAEGFAYWHDLSKNRIEFELRLSNRIAKGLFINAQFELSVIHDQLYLPKGDATIEEILLNRKALATDFVYEFGIGLSYTFGSIFNNVVNTRL